MTKKRMPSEHRIAGLKEGDIQPISNDFGEFALLRLPMVDSEYGYQVINTNKAIESISDHCEMHNTMMNDAITEKSQDYMNDNRMEDA